MHILFINNSFPFPPTNGVELPIAMFAEEFAKQHKISFALSDELKEQYIKPSFVHRCFEFFPQAESGKKKMLKEFTLKAPFYYQGLYDLDTLKKEFEGEEFDYIWVGVDGLLGFAEFYKQHFNPNVKIIMGINEPQYTIMANVLRDFFKFRIGLNKEVMLYFIRYFTIKWNEKKYLKRSDYIHVHTQVDEERTKALVKGSKAKVIKAPNGIKEELFTIHQGNPENPMVLFMTHLDDSRELEYPWFIKNVWPKVTAEVENAELWMVGKPANERHKAILSQVKGVKMIGFVDSLSEAFENAALSVVPIYQNHGLINRVVDSMAAGVPVVCNEEPVSTLEGFESGTHGFATNYPQQMANSIIQLLKDKQLNEKIGANARAYAKNRPTWVESANKILSEIGI